MTYRSLLVLLDPGRSSADRSACAVRLAKALDCHLVGLAPADLVDLAAAPAPAASLEDYAGRVWDSLREQSERAADRFRDDCHREHLGSFETVVVEAEKIGALLRHAHCCDLTVVTQADASDPRHAAARELVERMVLHSARPTLVLPRAGWPGTPGQRVLVAFDDSRESARAVSDALPLLQRATRVEVVQWIKTSAREDGSEWPQIEAFSQWLLWHGVAVEARLEATDANLAEAIVSRAVATEADLVVMGAYGRTRWAERVLGGTTRGVLESTTLPVLMSH